MSNDPRQAFEDRLKRIQGNAPAAPKGDKTARRLGIDPVPTPKPKRRLRVPFKTIAVALIAYEGLKVFLVLNIGEPAYQARISELKAGTTGEVVGSAILGVDPLTAMVVGRLEPWAAESLGWPVQRPE